MNLIFKNKNFLSILFIIFFILGGGFYLSELLNKSQNNVKLLSTYGNSIIGNNNLDTSNIGNFSLVIGGVEIQGSSLSDFVEKIDSFYSENLKKKIIIKIEDEQKNVIKIYDNYTYEDFSYALNIKGISEKIRFAIINGNSSLSLGLGEFIFFDNKKFNEVLGKIKSEFNETHLGQLYYDSENKVVKVNNNKIFLTQITDTLAKIEDVSTKLNLSGSEITLVLEKRENELFQKADILNNQIKKIKDINISLRLQDLKGFNVNVIRNYYKGNKNKFIQLGLENGLELKLSKGFLVDYISFDSDKSLIVFNENKFLKDFSFLMEFKIIDKDYQIIENPSLYQIKDGTLESNSPLNSDFRLIFANNFIENDSIGLLKELKIIFNTLSTDFETNVIYSDILKLKPLDRELNVRLNIKDQQILSKNSIGFQFKKGLYRNNDFLGEMFINYSNFPFKITNSGESGCYIQDNTNLYCGNNLLVGGLGYDKGKIIIKNVNNLFWNYHYDDVNATKFGGNFILNSNTVSLTDGDKYFNNIVFDNKITSIIYDFNLNNTPKILNRDSKNTQVVNDKLLLYYKPGDKSYFLVKDNGADFLFYLFDIEIYE